MSCIKKWKVGYRVLGLMSNNCVVIKNEEDYDQYTLATGLPGLLALQEALEEVIEEVKDRRKKANKSMFLNT